ncbi:ATP-binding protein [Bacillus pinisoli]|uniref:ATP-binding protein n=1 Tax=Bacillus pinisoli TaxID=2901866 RepID=UPI001FF68BE4|nr:ATP-binding protein [Bacillus pinisoli]
MIISRLLENKTINFKSLFNYLEDMIFVIRVEEDDVYRCIEVNNAYLKSSGLMKKQIINKRVEDIIPYEEAQEVIRKYQAAILSRSSLTYEECITLNGIIKTFETTIIPVFEEDETTCINIIGIARDISLRKRYQEEILSTKEMFQKVIHHQQGLIYSLEKKADDYIYTLFDGQILQNYEELTKEVVGKRPQDIMEREIAVEIINRYNQCWNNQEKIVFEEKDQTGGTLLTVLSPVVEQHKTTQIIGSTIDISDKKRAEEALVKKEKLSLLGELSAGIGHEIRNPLTTIKGFIKMMKEDPAHIKPEYLDVIQTEIESIDRIAGELMMLAKPQALQMVPFNIVVLLKDVMFLMESQAFTSGVDMEITSDQDILLINGDRNQIKQVFINLIKNSIESMESSMKGKVRVVCSHTIHEVSIKVIDEGCGITEEKIKSIGEPFYTTKTKGNGLGLMITQRIIKNHQGVINCDSQVGRGTTFTVTLPLFVS